MLRSNSTQPEVTDVGINTSYVSIWLSSILRTLSFCNLFRSVSVTSQVDLLGGGEGCPHPSPARNRLCRHAVFSTAKFGGLDTIWGSGGFPSPPVPSVEQQLCTHAVYVQVRICCRWQCMRSDTRWDSVIPR